MYIFLKKWYLLLHSWKFCWYFVFSNSLNKLNFLHFVCWKCINHNAVELSFENHLPSWVHFIWEAYKLSVEKILAQPFSKHQRICFLFANAYIEKSYAARVKTFVNLIYYTLPNCIFTFIHLQPRYARSPYKAWFCKWLFYIL